MCEPKRLFGRLRHQPAVGNSPVGSPIELCPAGTLGCEIEPFEPFNLAVVDCSFISLRQILPATVDLLPPGGQVVVLVKPQFEAGKAEADKGRGVIRDPQVHRRVLDELRAFVDEKSPLEWVAEIESPLTGPAGNREFLVLLNR